MSVFTIVRYREVDAVPTGLVEILEGRRRPWVVVDRHAGGQEPSSPGGMRALVLLGPPDAAMIDEAVARQDCELVTACAQQEIAVLGLNAGADLVAAACGAPTAAKAADLVGWTTLRLTAAADDDAMAKGLVDGSRWLAATTISREVPDSLAVLATDLDERALLFGADRLHGVRVRLDPPVDAARAASSDAVASAPLAAQGSTAEQLAAEAQEADLFGRGWSAALLGRWVDGVVGRTEEEMPWGRRGPAPRPSG